MLLTTIVSDNSSLTDCLSGILREDYLLSHSDDIGNSLAESRLLLLGHDQLGKYPLSELSEMIKTHEEQGTPVILVWDDSNADYRELAIELGCSDYLGPPLYASVVNSKCKTYISLAKLKQGFGHVELDDEDDSVSEHDQFIEAKELLAVQDAAILCLATIARIRDHSTGNHILRTQHYVKALAEHLRKLPKYQKQLDKETIELFYKTSALHDIGKVGIPDHILCKPGALTADEYSIMKNHTVLGYQAVNSAYQMLEKESGSKAVKFLKFAQQVTLSHHERWDGKGYPQGLKGEDIPLVARLMAVADVYDAMISRRPYKSALDHEEVKNVILSGRGTHFDPDIVDAFIDLQDMFERISIRLEDVFPSTADLTLHSMADLINEQAKASEL
ncbi:HD-GYP domain-containing protein [Neptuniibacter caesariensis]|uniref:Regulatory component of sensory transduction system n=1 Tax=Neptuniibacter caesariensis TaxID=207954 RepID=A0A7U8GRV9_NEPCE|nr:HD domain-containing phosphohydrolase [Neptuniibacter caesariensis]EAR61812.1 regulatory component of sensory transduction system [Neptuniibacter caesariensis]